MSAPTPSPESRVIPTLRDTAGTVYAYVRRWDYEGRWMLCYQWFDAREPDNPQIYEVTPEERDDLIACGWWTEVAA